MITKNYKLYGRGGPSLTAIDYCNDNIKGKKAMLRIQNAGVTGCDDYSIVSVTAESEKECRRILDAQISDGFFEHYDVDRIEEL